MSKIDELMAQFCPDGVEYKEIKNICNINRGRVISKTYINENTGVYPVYSSQTENNGELGFISSFDFDGEYITWTTDGANAGTVFYRLGKFSVTNVCGILKVKCDDVISKFVYYTLSVEAPKYVNAGMGNPKLMSNVMGKIKLPVPPLEVQREIVRILDNFTGLTTELTTELTARKQQYEHYRSELLNLKNIKFEKKSLAEIANFKTGKKPDRIYEYCVNGSFHYVNAGTSPSGYVMKPNQECDVVTTPSRGQGGIGFVGYQDKPFWLGPLCYGIRTKNPNAVITKYIYHCLRNQSEDLIARKNEGGTPSLNAAALGTIEILIPDIITQCRIVDILDKFEAICNNLNIGLPAEIDARQKQYEYYRDKLLSFGNER